MVKSIESFELKSWMETKQKFSLIDIRSQEERSEWLIPNSLHLDIGKQFSRVENDLTEGLRIPQDRPVVIVCNSGIKSRKVSEILTSKGYDAYSLEGGMKSWNYVYDTSSLKFDDFEVIQVKRIAKGCLSYIVGSKGEALVIDPALHPSVYIHMAQAKGWKIKFITDTHVHADFVSRSKELAVLTKADHLLNHKSEVSFSFTGIKNGDRIQLGKTEIEVVETPGHTWESTSFLINQKILFTGDTLFIDGIGRPDLKADHEEAKKKSLALFNSLQRITALPEETLILPAHYSKSIEIEHPMLIENLATLLETIPLLSSSKKAFIAYIAAKIPKTPANYLKIIKINKSGKIGTFKISDLEIGTNHCAI